MEDNNQVIIDIGLDALIASLRDLQKQYEANTAAMKALRDEGKQDSDEYIQLTQANKVLRQEMNGVEKSIQNNIKAEKAQEGSLVQLRAQLANLNKQYDSMSGFERMGTAGEALRTKIKALSDNISSLEANTGRYQRNVGNYKSALEGLSGSFKMAGLSTAGLDKSLKLLGANPIMIFFTAIVGAVKSLGSAFKNNEENLDRWKLVIAPINRILELASNSMQQFASKILGVVEAGKSALNWVGNMLQKLPFLRDRINDLNEEMRDSIALEKEAQAIRNERRKEDVEQAKASLESQRLLTKAYDKANYTAKERLEFLRQATKIEQDRADAAELLAKRELELARQRASISKNDSKTNDELAAKEAAYYQAQQQREALQTSLKRRESQLLSQIASEEKEIEQQRKKSYEESKKANEARINAMKEAEDAIISLMQEGEEKQIALENSQYKKSKELLEAKLADEKKKHGESTELYKAYTAQLEAMEKAHEKKLDDIHKAAALETINTEKDVIARRIELADKGTKEEFDLRRQQLAKTKEAALLNEKLTDEQRLLIEEKYQQDLTAIDEAETKARQDKRKKELENRINEMQLSYQKTGELELQLLQENLDNLAQLQGESDEDFYARRLAAQKTYNDKKKALDAAEMAMEKAKAGYMASITGSISDLMETVAGDNKEMVKASKVVALAEVAIKQGVAIAEAVAASANGDPYTYSLRVAAAIASTVAAMASAIASINKASSFETGGVIGGYNGATMGADNTYISARKGEMVLNADQQRRLFDIANGNSQTSLAESLFAAIQAMPAPVMVYSEYNDFKSRVATFNETAKLK